MIDEQLSMAIDNLSTVIKLDGEEASSDPTEFIYQCINQVARLQADNECLTKLQEILNNLAQSGCINPQDIHQAMKGARKKTNKSCIRCGKVVGNDDWQTHKGLIYHKICLLDLFACVEKMWKKDNGTNEEKVELVDMSKVIDKCLPYMNSTSPAYVVQTDIDYVALDVGKTLEEAKKSELFKVYHGTKYRIFRCVLDDIVEEGTTK